MSRIILGGLTLDAELDRLMKAAARHKMTAQEIWDQRVSFVRGQLMDCAPDITREQIEAAAERVYGPRPEAAE